VLETFSITPLEALYMNMPMIVSDIQANKQVVGDYATYVKSLDCEDIVAKFIDVISHYDEEVNKLIQIKSGNYFEKIPCAAKRYSTYKSILKTMVKQ
jgi:glycosyltransferase involved in cell wall biosynthesis